VSGVWPATRHTKILMLMPRSSRCFLRRRGTGNDMVVTTLKEHKPMWGHAAPSDQEHVRAEMADMVAYFRSTPERLAERPWLCLSPRVTNRVEWCCKADFELLHSDCPRNEPHGRRTQSMHASADLLRQSQQTRCRAVVTCGAKREAGGKVEANHLLERNKIS